MSETMSESIKKPIEANPKRYSLKTPKLTNMMEVAKENMHEQYVHDIISGKNYSIDNLGSFAVGKFADIKLVFAAEFMAVKVNGELRHIGNNCEYINEFKINPEYRLSSPVTITPEAATVTIEKLRITEL